MKDDLDLGFIRPVPDLILQEMNLETSRLHIVQRVMLEGGAQFLHELEHTYYPPGTPANDLLQLMFHHWNGWPWTICSIPLRDRANAEAAAAKTGMRLADGYPITFAIAGQHPDKALGLGSTRYEKIADKRMIHAQFPLNSRRTYTLEKDHKTQRPVVSALVFGEQKNDDFWKMMLRTNEKMVEAAKRDRAERN